MSDEGDSDSLVQALRNAYARLVAGNASGQALRINSRIFVGVRGDGRCNLDLANLRRTIYEEIEPQHPASRLVQVVGDSGTAFDEAKIPFAQKALSRHLGGDLLIEYGFTCIEHDANWLVQDHISRRPEVAACTIANIVGQSLEALNSAKWTGSEHLRTFVVLYNENGTPTKFGEDCWVSDGILSGETGDKLLCFEGGLQAFHQCVNALLAGVEVLAMADLRPAKDAPRLSAAQLLLSIADLRDDSNPSGHLVNWLDVSLPGREEYSPGVRNDLTRLQEAGIGIAWLIKEM